MNEPPETHRPEPQRLIRGKFFLPFTAILCGSALLIIREYLAKGRVSGIVLGASFLALVIGLIILIILGRYANKPEE
jgi:hypothetical protein